MTTKGYKLIRSAIVTLSLTLFATSAIAAGPLIYQPQVQLPAQPIQIPNRSIDILGIQIGMSPSSARSAAEAALPSLKKVRVQNDNLSFTHRGMTVQTPDYIGSTVFNIQDTLSLPPIYDSIGMVFSGPASGNQLISAVRTTTYRDVIGAPTIDAMTNALVAKYGAPSYSEPGREPFFSWTFIAGEQRTCRPRAECAFPEGEYSARNLPDIARDPSQSDLALHVKLTNSASDLAKVSQAHFFLGSATKRKMTAKVDNDSLAQAAESAWSKASQNVSAPKL